MRIVLSVILAITIAFIYSPLPEIKKEKDTTSHGSTQVDIVKKTDEKQENTIDINDIMDNYNGFWSFGIKNTERLQNLLINEDCISVVCYRLDGEKAFSYNTDNQYFSACTIKAGYVYFCCSQIEKGLFDKNSRIVYEKKHFHTGSGRIKNGNFGDTYTIEELISLCLSISDNVAYEMLVDTFGKDEYNKFIIDKGCNSLVLPSYSIWGQKIKACDLVKIWHNIYQYFNSESEESQILRKACTNTPFNYITRNLDCEYSHKSGDNFGNFAVYNDAAIVWSSKPYIIIALSNKDSNSNIPVLFDNISKISFDEFTNN